jgi:hypothetical protein
MQRHALIIKQIEVSKSLIKENETASLRISLLLLDNTIETLMYRFIGTTLLNRFDSKLKEMPFSFPDKAKLLVNEKYISREIGDFVCFSHRYRNEIYHKDVIKKETLKPLVIVLFEIVANIFSSLEVRTFDITPDEKLKAFEVKYRISLGHDFKSDIFIKIVKKITAEFSISTSEVKKLLISHINNRIDDLVDQIMFVIDENKAITLSWATKDEKFKAVFALNIDYQIKRWNKKIRQVETSKGKLETINGFMDLENDVENVEHIVIPAVWDLDQYIDNAIQMMREEKL